MAGWKHVLCAKCWFQGNAREPVRVLDAPVERCCQCGRDTAAGIYLRADPRAMACQGRCK